MADPAGAVAILARAGGQGQWAPPWGRHKSHLLEHHGVSNHRQLTRLFNNLFRSTRKKTPNLHMMGHLCGETRLAATGGFPFKMPAIYDFGHQCLVAIL